MSRFIAQRGLPSAVAAVLVLAVYVVCLWRMPLDVFWSPDEGGKFFELASIEWNGHLDYAPPYAGRRLDPELRFYPGSTRGFSFPYPRFDAGGQVRFHWPIWFPLLGRIFLEAFGVAGIYVVPLLSGWLIALLSGWIAARFDRRLAAPAILLVGLATPIWFYSLNFWEHTLAAMLALAAVAVAIGARAASPRRLLAALTLLAAATVLRLEMIAFAASLLCAWGLSAWRSHRVASDPRPAPRTAAASRLRWLALVAVAALLAVAVSLTLTERHSRQLTGVPAKIPEAFAEPEALARAWQAILVDNRTDEGPKMPPRRIAFTALALLACFAAPFLPGRIEGVVLLPALSFVLWYSIGLARLEQTYRSLHGIFAIAPYLALWTYALRPSADRSPHQRLLADTAGLYLIAGGAAVIVGHGDGGSVIAGLEWGARYLLALYPMLAILALVALYDYVLSSRTTGMKRVVFALATAMIAVAVQLEMRGVAMLRSNHQRFAAFQQALRPEEPVITDLWWLPSSLAPLFVSGDAYRVHQRGEVADWVALARVHGLSAFTFVSDSPVEGRHFAVKGLRPVPERSRELRGLYIARFALD